MLQTALEEPHKSHRELAAYITDTQETFISESNVYRILKAYDLILNRRPRFAETQDIHG